MITKKWSVVFLLLISLSNSQLLLAMKRSSSGSSVSSDDKEVTASLLASDGLSNASESREQDDVPSAHSSPRNSSDLPTVSAQSKPAVAFISEIGGIPGTSSVFGSDSTAPVHSTIVDITGQRGTELMPMGGGAVAPLPVALGSSALGKGLAEKSGSESEKDPGCCDMCWETFKHCPTVTADVCWRNRTPRQKRWIKIGLWTAGEIGISLAAQQFAETSAAAVALRETFATLAGYEISALTAHSRLAYQFLSGCALAAADSLLAVHDVLGKHYPKGSGIVFLAAVSYLACANANMVGVMNGATTNLADFEEWPKPEQHDFIDQTRALGTYAETGELVLNPSALKRWCTKNLEIFGQLTTEDQDRFIRLLIKVANAANNRSTLTNFLRQQHAIATGTEMKQLPPTPAPLLDVTSELLKVIAKNFPEYDLWMPIDRVRWATQIVNILNDYLVVYADESRYDAICSYIQTIQPLPNLPSPEASDKNKALWMLYGLAHKRLPEFKQEWNEKKQKLFTKTLFQALELIKGHAIDDLRNDLARCLEQPELTIVSPKALLAMSESLRKFASGNDMSVATLPQPVTEKQAVDTGDGCCGKISQAWASASQHTRDVLDTLTVGGVTTCCNVIEGLFSGGSKAPIWISRTGGKAMGEILEEYSTPKKLAVAAAVGLADYFFTTRYLKLFPVTGLIWLPLVSFCGYTAKQAFYKARKRDVLPKLVKEWPLELQYVATAAENGLVEGTDVNALLRQTFVDCETWTSEKRLEIIALCEEQLQSLATQNRSFDERAFSDFREKLMHLAAEPTSKK